MIQIENLNYQYPKAKTQTLKSLNLKLDGAPRIVGLLGPNGAGKSTLFRLLSTEVSSQNGTLKVLGLDLPKQEHSLRQVLGVTFQNPSLDLHLTVFENLKIHAALYGRTSQEFEQETKDLLKTFLLEDYRNRFVKELSGGQKRKLELAKVFLSHPKMLLLDEPTTGLDPSARAEFWALLKRLQKEKQFWVLASTHLMEEAELCDEVLLMNEGTIKGQGTPESLRKSLGYDILDLEAFGEENPALELELLDHIGGLWRYRVQDGDKIIESYFKQGILARVKSFRIGKPTMSDVYFKYCGVSLK